MLQPTTLDVSDEQARRIAARHSLDYSRTKLDPWYPVQRGFVYTEDEKRGGAKLPMPATPYMGVLTRLWQIYPIGMILKSRQLMMSWLWCWLHLWQALYWPGSLGILQGKRKDDVIAIGTKNLMGRVMFMYHNLPDFLRPANVEIKQKRDEKDKTTLTSLVVPGGGTLLAVPQGPNILRSKTATSVTMDELPHHPDGKEAWNTTLPTVDGGIPVKKENPPWVPEWNERFPKMAVDFEAGTTLARLWGIGTPNGRDALCFKAAPWEQWRAWEEVTKNKYDTGDPVEGLRVYLKRRSWGETELAPIICARLHYTAEYAPESWNRRRASRAGYDNPASYERENEISFRVAEGTPVFTAPEFGARHLVRHKVQPRLPTCATFDTGWNGQSVCLWQESVVKVGGDRYWRRGHLFWHKLWKAKGLGDVIVLVKQQLYEFGIDWNYVTFKTDWNTLTGHAGGTGVTDMSEFIEHGIHPVARRVGPNQKSQTINLVRRALKTWPDGRPGLEVDPVGAPMVVEMFDGGYRYEEPPPGKGITETPLKDGVYDHIGDSVCYHYWPSEQEIWNSLPEIEVLPAERGTTDEIREHFIRKQRSRRSLADRDDYGPGGRTGGF